MIPFALDTLRTNVPIEMQAQARWLCWRLTWHQKRSAWVKLPLCAKRKGTASSTDPNSWATFDQAVEAVPRLAADGVGYALGDGLVGIDGDDLIDPDTGKLGELAQSLVAEADSYAERSPGGAGLHIIVRGHLPEGFRTTDGIEVYPQGRYFTVTGETLGAAKSVAPAADLLATLYARRVSKTTGTPGGQGPDDACPSPCADVPERFHVLLASDGILAARWTGKVADLNDQSGSGLALSLVSLLRHRGFSLSEVAAILRSADAPAGVGRHVDDRALERMWQRAAGVLPGSSCGAGAINWPEPLDLIGAPELVGWPSLVPDCLPEALHRYVMGEAERLNVDPVPVAGHVLAACSASISDAWCIKPKRHDTWTQQARLWVCIVKDVGARGTEMIRSAFWPLRQRDAELFNNWKAELAAWRGREANRDKKAKSEPEPHCTRLVTNDTTVEAASEILAGVEGDHGKLAVLCDELAGFLGSFTRYDRTGAARAAWLEAYDGGPHRIDRIKRGHVYVPNWSVVVAGNIQPRRLAGIAPDLVDDGLFQRFLTLHARPSDVGGSDDHPIDPALGRDYQELQTVLAALRPPIGAEGKPAIAHVDEGGLVERSRFMPLIDRLRADPTLPTIIRETAPKWSGLLARLALIFHLVELARQQLDGATFEPRDLCEASGQAVTTAATFVRRVALPNLFRLGFETMPEEGAPAGHARWIAGHLLAQKLDAVTARDIGRAYRDLRGKPALVSEVMDVLADAGWARRAENRHDSARWEVNPAIHVRFAAAAAAEAERRTKIRQIIREKVADL